MTVDERDQWECLLADWSAAYDITRGDDGTDELEAASPRLLRAMIREDHARRTAAAAPQDAP
jgi:hypothetical protein